MKGMEKGEINIGIKNNWKHKFNRQKSPRVWLFYHKIPTQWLHRWIGGRSRHLCGTSEWAVYSQCAHSTPDIITTKTTWSLATYVCKTPHSSTQWYILYLLYIIHGNEKHRPLNQHTFNVLSSAALIIFQLSACKCLYATHTWTKWYI